MRLFPILLLLLCSPATAQYYGSSGQAYRYARSSSVSVERLPGPHWAAPHSGCTMCLGNHLISHGYSYAYLNQAGYQNWQVLHDNAHNKRLNVTALKSPPVQPIYAPTPDAAIARLLGVCPLDHSSIFVDLGSGDGRVVLAVAKRFSCKCVGVECDSSRVVQSRKLAQQAGAAIAGRVTFYKADVCNVDLSKVDVVYVYLEASTLKKLLPRFRTLKPSAKLFSYQHPVPGMVLERVEYIGDTILFQYARKT